MVTIWDAARALLAMTGSEEAAVEVARELSEVCESSGDTEEAEFWSVVEDVVPWEANSQPLIAPDIRPKPRTVQRGPMGRYRGQMELPKQRSNVLRFRRELRALWNRHQSEDKEIEDSDDEG